MDLIEPTLDALGFHLVRVRVLGGSARQTVQVMAERRDGSMTVDDCAELNRTLSPMLDVADPISGEYALEVSSPGIDRPLVRLADFERFAGHKIRIELKEPIDGRRRFKGILDGIDGDQVLMALEGDDDMATGFPFALIRDAKLVLTDELMRSLTNSSGGERPAEPADALGRTKED